MNKCFYYLGIAFIIGLSILSDFSGHLVAGEEVQNTLAPKYLYKVLALQDWKESQTLNFVILPKEDEEFIHFSTEEQLDRIINKYWSNVNEYVILKIETAQLPGKLVLEANQAGGNKYYHLYGGSIPLKSIVQAKIIKPNKNGSPQK